MIDINTSKEEYDNFISNLNINLDNAQEDNTNITSGDLCILEDGKIFIISKITSKTITLLFFNEKENKMIETRYYKSSLSSAKYIKLNIEEEPIKEIDEAVSVRVIETQRPLVESNMSESISSEVSTPFIKEKEEDVKEEIVTIIKKENLNKNSTPSFKEDTLVIGDKVQFLGGKLYFNSNSKSDYVELPCFIATLVDLDYSKYFECKLKTNTRTGYCFSRRIKKI